MRSVCGLLFLALGKPFHCDYILSGKHLTSVLQVDVLCTPHVFITDFPEVFIYVCMMIIFVVFLVKSTPLCTSYLKGEGRRGSFKSETHHLCLLGPRA